MKGATIVLGEIAGRETAALMKDGKLDDLFVAHDGPVPGAIYRAVAGRPMKGQGGIFLETPDGPVYLRQIKGISPGETLLVQVTSHAEPGKAVPVTHKILFKSRYAIVTPEAPGLNVSRQIKDDDLRDALLEIAHELMEGSEYGLILRSSCDGADEAAIAEDIAEMRTLAESVMADKSRGAELLVEGDGPEARAWREWTVPASVERGSEPLEATGALEAIEALSSPIVPLGGGASMAVEETRALVAVDVNTGGDTSPAAGLKATIAALRDLPRQLRVRGLGGVIVIDPAPFPKKERRQIEQVLRAALRADPVETNFVGWTPMGNIELQRKRDRIALTEILR
ncbi:ribonuclease E/G [Roseivivax sp. THAF30]|uniref:ribonuclease E/G n=1 Tax=Roseivivax sp. THAF30 TaxID=2587852 RepID=UPI0012698770|nr:ribonuclease E/G [Roseivivax sp. THAF30]QFT64124.1 Ribonuclease G [Roseivivax sp. THAF30]